MKLRSIKELNCKRCGHNWFPNSKEIRICPKCKSTYWNSEEKSYYDRRSKWYKRKEGNPISKIR
jgi:predicted Zn-ribbon and HTH transcriptional regulator